MSRRLLSRRVEGRWPVAVLGTAALLMALVLPGVAEAQNVSDGKRIYKERAACSFCHGWSGDGQGDPFSEGLAANLRESELTREQMSEVIRCGRPGTAMPFFERAAYTDDRCYGMTAAQIGEDKPDAAKNTFLRARQLNQLLDYMFVKIVGRGEITLAECEEYFSPGSRSCEKYQ